MSCLCAPDETNCRICCGSPVLHRIERVADELIKDRQELSPTMLMWQFCNQTMDDELKRWRSDLVDVAEKIEYLWETRYKALQS